MRCSPGGMDSHLEGPGPGWVLTRRAITVPSAWVDPLQVFVIAASFSLFGEHGRLALVLLNVLWMGLTALLIVLCCRDRFREGILAALLFLLMLAYVSRPWLYIGNTALASFLFTLVAFLLFLSLERPSFPRSAALGSALGVANLAHAGSLLFGVAGVALLLFRYGLRKPR